MRWLVLAAAVTALLVPTSSQAQTRVRCTRPPQVVYGVDVGLEIEPKIPPRANLARIRLSAEGKALEVRQLLPGIEDFRVLEHAFCEMYRRRRITRAEYGEFVRQVLPIIRTGACARPAARARGRRS